MRDHFTEDHEAYRDSFASFVAKEITPHYAEWEAAGIAPKGIFAAAGQYGYVGMAVPEAHGGGGTRDFRFNQVIAEVLADQGIGGAGLGITLHNDITTPYFVEYCNDEQAARWLPGIASGELVTAIAMTEPGTGSDLASIATTAVRDGDTYVVNGSKTFITNGINADLVIVVAKTDPTQRHTGMSLLVVERAIRPASSAGRKLEKVGHAQPRHGRAVLRPTCACAGREPPRRGGQGLPLPDRTTWPRNGCRSPSPVWRRPQPPSAGRWRTSRNAERSASPCPRSRTPSSSWPR